MADMTADITADMRAAQLRQDMPVKGKGRGAPALAALLTAALFAPLILPSPARAQATVETVFDVSIGGIGAGTLNVASIEAPESYAIAAALRTRGLAEAIRSIRYEGKTRGLVQDGNLRPTLYQADIDTGRRQLASTLGFEDGVPQVLRAEPPVEPRPEDVDPATQGGALDPLSGFYMALRPMVPGQECNLTVNLFDGRRASRLTLGPPTPQDEGRVSCAGEYRRVAGYSAEELAERTHYTLTATYGPDGAGAMRLEEIEVDTLIGAARLVRK